MLVRGNTKGEAPSRRPWAGAYLAARPSWQPLMYPEAGGDNVLRYGLYVREPSRSRDLRVARAESRDAGHG